MPTSLHTEKTIFLEAAEIASPTERAEFLDRSCGDDQELRAAVEALLRSHQRPQGALDATVAPLAERPGTQIGPYKLLQQIGEGGMGVVYMAEQTEPVQRKVALKVIKPGMDSRPVIARFEAERQALAMMDHVNIARVLDAGATESRRPYFVMELVHGVPITKYCDDNRLTPRQRLELFVPVCQAIQHAHQKGIIHRDIKPSNVMVTHYDGKPVPKVIDFGVAKATEQKLTERTLFTQYGTMVGTLEYMSPEQAEMSALGVDTRSDIFSLGVLLYELLTGSTPLSSKRMKEVAYAEILRLIKEEEPPKPSTRLSDSGEALASISAQRHMEPAKLSKLMRGELDWIVMKTLEKDRNRRYETAKDFAADVQRYLNDETVQACPPSAAYRFRKFARRNRGVLVTVTLTLVVVLLVAGSAGWTMWDRAGQRATVAARAEQVLGESEALYRQRKLPEAAQVARTALALVSGGAGGPAVERRAREWLKDLDMVAGLEEIHARRGDRQMKRVEYPQAFREYGIDVEALPPADAAAALAAQSIAVDLAAALDQWAREDKRGVDAKKGTALRARLEQIARLADPDPLRNRVRDAYSDKVPPGGAVELTRQITASVDLASTPLVTLTTIGEGQYSLSEMIAFFTRVQQQHPGDFGVTFRLGQRLRVLGDSEGAIRFLTAAVAIRPQSAIAHSELGRALLNKGRVDEAIAAQREAVRFAPGEATYRLRMGIALLWKPGLEQDAAAAFRKATRVALDAHGARGAANIQRVVAVAYTQKGKLDEAITAYREAARLVPDDPHSRHHLGIVLEKKGLLDESIAAHQESARFQPQEPVAHSALGGVLNKKGRWEEAAAAYGAAIRLQPENAWLHHFLGDNLAQTGRFAEAEAAFREAIRMEPNDGGRHHNLGDVLRNQRKFCDAAAEYAEAIRLRPDVHASYYGLGSVSAFRGQWDQAAPAFERAAELNPADLGASYRWATLCVYNNDMEGYQRAWRAMLDRFGETNDIQVAGYTAKACALAPILASDEMRVTKLGELVLAGTEAHPARRWFEVTKALVDYRVGRFGSAAEAIGHWSPAGDGTHRDVLAFSILAMAQQRQGKVEDAHTAMSKARRIISTKMPDIAMGQTFGEDWLEWLHAQILCLEAEKLLKE